MKKYSLFLAVLFILLLSFGAISADGEWVAWEADLSEAAEIKCTFAEASLIDEDVKEILGDVTENDWAIGPEDAILTLVEYADFQCPYCSRAGLEALKFQAAHPEEVRYVYRHFPLTFHEKAPMSAYAADAAGKQGFFFEMENFLYETQNEWSGLETLDDFDAWLREKVPAVLPDLDFDKWVSDYESEEIRTVVDGAFDNVAATGIINGTPTFFANFFQVSMDPEELERYISLFGMQKNYRSVCPVFAVEEGKDYRAVLHTNAGDIVIDLLENEAPNLVSNFMLLAKDGFYNNNAFHNVIQGFAAQTGDPSATGVGLAGYYLADENLGKEGFNEPGAVAMANTGTDKNSSQFFITMDLNDYFKSLYTASGNLSEAELNEKIAKRLDTMNARYSVFGRVTEESLEILPMIDMDTVIESIDIEVRG